MPQPGSPSLSAADRRAFTPAESGTFSRKCKAFTLIELLVVIAIIAILAAILFPVFAQAVLGGAALMLMTVGCTYAGNTSGFKAEQKPSKAEIDRQIEQIKTNPNMPANARAAALKKPEQDRASAR